MVKREITAIVEGASLGSIAYQPNAAVTGYVAFFTIGLYMLGLVLLPARGERSSADTAIVPSVRGDIVVVLIAAALTASGCSGTAAATGAADPSAGVSPSRAQAREDALRAARVWHEPSIPIAAVDFSRNPAGPGSLSPDDDVWCRYVPQELSGTTPKFRCELPGGAILKVKYGARNPELAAEVAATRLLAALGFGADRMYVVRRVLCAGCPPYPFHALKCDRMTGLSSLCFSGGFDYGRIRTFDAAVVEARMPGDVIEAASDQGWGWFELDRIDPAHGGSSRAEVDALRLLAVVLAHWDNKGPNQRLICPPGAAQSGRCGAPVAIVQDLGATFGPLKLDLPNWRRVPVWSDRASCTVSMKGLPYGGATFPDHRITEEGRVLLARLLEQLSDAQLTDLFTASGIVSYDHISAEGRQPAAWVAAFNDKVRQVRDGPACP
jgi:hypothetical protein